MRINSGSTYSRSCPVEQYGSRPPTPAVSTGEDRTDLVVGLVEAVGA